MATVLERVPDGARVAVIRLRSLGDCVLTTPALRILKQSRPDLKIAVIVEARFAAVFEGNPDVDAVLPPAITAILVWGARVCINLHGGTRSMALALSSWPALRVGFAHHRLSRVYHIQVPRAQDILRVDRKVHTAEHLASVMFHLGVESCDVPRAALFALPAPGSAPYAVLHPVASSPEKTWRADGFLEVASRLRRSGIDPVFISGRREDLTPFREFRTIAGAPLGEIKTVLSRASVFIGNDSGPAHMAAAFGVPSVVVFGNSDPEVWGPWKTPSETLVARGPIQSVATGDVLAALERLRVAA